MYKEYTSYIEMHEYKVSRKTRRRKMIGGDKDRDLTLAVFSGNMEEIERLISAGANVNNTSYNNMTPFHMAIFKNNTTIAERLIRAGADVNGRSQGITPLIDAVDNNKVEMIKFLLDARAEVDKARSDGTTPLFTASANGHLEVVKALLKARAEVDKARSDGTTPLHMATQKEHLEIVKALLEAGADVNKAKNDGTTPLYIASHGYLEIVKALLEAGADVNKVRSDSATPLFIASEIGHLEIVKALLEAGADANKSKRDSTTPLFIASEIGHLEIVKALLEAGADANKATRDSTTPLFTASANGHLEIVKVLLEAGADVNKAKNDNITPLLFACNGGYLDIINILLEAGADVNKGTYRMNVTPLLIASEAGRINIVNRLLEAGANVNAITMDGHTPLFVASQNGHIEVVQALLAAGADKGIADNTGKLPIDVAKTEEIRNLLEDPIPWEGWSLADDKTLDTLFTDDGAKNFTVCPICLKHTNREDGCMYMKHKCKELKGFYHKKLYNKYKDADGNVHWCTYCGRICGNHRHYNLGVASGPIPTYAAPQPATHNVFFEPDCRGANGGGGIPEKIERFRIFRHQARELETQRGIITRKEAMEELVEILWNAPLLGKYQRRVKTILDNKRWNFAGENVFQAAPVPELENTETNAPNIPRPATNVDLLPRLVPDGMNAVSLEDVPVVEFVHRQPNGTINEHKGQGIGLSVLKTFIEKMNKKHGTEEFGFCWNYGLAPDSCRAHLHPDEVKMAFELLGEPNEELVADYRKKFNKRFRV